MHVGGLELRELVEGCCRQHALPPDVIDDIVAEAAARLPGDAELGEIVAAVDGLVRAEADRSGRRCVALLLPGAGVPALLPGFVRLADLHPRPRPFRRSLGSAAVALARLRLDRERFFLFFLAWIEGERIDAMIETPGRGPESRRADREERRTVQRRLRRISRTLERALLADVEPQLPYRERTWLRAAVTAPNAPGRRAPPLPPPAASSWSLLARALGGLVHRGAGPGATRPGPGAATTPTQKTGSRRGSAAAGD